MMHALMAKETCADLQRAAEHMNTVLRRFCAKPTSKHYIALKRAMHDLDIVFTKAAPRNYRPLS